MENTERVKLVLDPKTWYRGLGDTESALLTSDNRMCCLGFECRRRGYTVEDIFGETLPTNVDKLSVPERKLFLERVGVYSILETLIARINDDIVIKVSREGDLDRISKLQPYFDKLGVELVLAEDPPDYDRAGALAEQDEMVERMEIAALENRDE